LLLGTNQSTSLVEEFLDTARSYLAGKDLTL
jgi:hypothetical protein